MGIKKNILIDGKEVPFKASAAVPRLYRLKFGRDIYRDFASLEDSVRQDAKKQVYLFLRMFSLQACSLASIGEC